MIALEILDDMQCQGESPLEVPTRTYRLYKERRHVEKEKRDIEEIEHNLNDGESW